MSEKGLELLAPAGNLDILKAVVNSGCDAVYFGGQAFGARAFAKNFSIKEAEEGIKYAHSFNAKAFLTLNTLIKNMEYKDLYSYIKEYYEAGIDAILVQDYAVLNLLRESFPDVEIHASTQLSVSNSYGAEYLKNLGVKRIVLSRELSLDEMKNIYDKTGVELEAFVHGAICVGYSGQCLLSSMLGGRSGNRGRCAQPCRLSYDVFMDGRKINNNEKYLLSPKDMCLISDIPALSKAGIYSLKIEGRMKSAEYAAGVTHVYRKYIDKYLETGKEYKVEKEDMNLLRGLGNRGNFTDNYLFFNNGKEMMSLKDSSLHTDKDISFEIPERKIPVNIYAEFKKGKEIILRLEDDNETICYGDIPSIAENRPLSRETVIKQLSKTGDTPFSIKNINISMDDDIFLPIGSINSLRRNFFDLLLKNKSVKERDRRIFPDSFSDKRPENNIDRSEKVFVLLEKKEQFDAIIPFINENYLLAIDHNLLSEGHEYISELKRIVKEKKASFVLRLPQIFRNKAEIFINNHGESIELFDYYTASSFDALGFLKAKNINSERIIIDHRLYTYNNRAVSDYKKSGHVFLCGPYELNKKELSHRDNSGTFLPVFGRTELMLTANCTRKNILGCDKKRNLLSLKDRKNELFKVKNDCTICMNTLYNSKPLFLFDKINEIEKMGFTGYRLDFTTENAAETREVMNMFLLSLQKRGEADLKKMSDNSFTRGHYNRGVE